MTKERLEKELAGLQQQYAAVVKQAVVIEGAIQALQGLLRIEQTDQVVTENQSIEELSTPE